MSVERIRAIIDDSNTVTWKITWDLGRHRLWFRHRLTADRLKDRCPGYSGVQGVTRLSASLTKNPIHYVQCISFFRKLV